MITSRSHLTLVPAIPLSRFSLVSRAPQAPLSLGSYLLSIYGSFSNGLRQQVKNGMFLRVANYCWFAFVTSHYGEFIKPLGVSMTPHAQIKKIPDVDLGSSL